MTKTVCNFCGNDFDEWDEQEGFGFDYHVGYGSGYDLMRVKCDLCCACFDKMMDEYIIPNCKISPLEGEYG